MDKNALIAILGQFGEADAIAEVIHDCLPLREELPARRRTERQPIHVKNQEVYVEVGFYEDNRPGEVFLKAGRVGSDVQDIFDALATVLSVAMQHGVPLSAFPITGKGNALTGEGNELVDEIVRKMEELCVPAVRDPQSSTSSSGSPSSTESSTSTSVKDPSSPSS